ncbi:MAG: amino acid permease [Polyangiaceae bacterium]|nr:amino acid permease [Polyangiaceae bacterium]
MRTSEATTSESQHHSPLGLWDAISIIVGIVIGAGIYETAPRVLANASGPGEALAIWAVGGALSLVGACCYAELASAYPRSGGDYVYLSRAFGPSVGFLFGWAQLAVLLTGSIGMMAYVFADYAASILPIGELGVTLFAAGAVAALTALNVAGTAAGKRTQNLLSVLKLLGLASIVVVGFVAAGQPRAHAAPSAVSGASLGLAMIFTLYTFGGWNDAAFVAAEVREPRKNLPRALVLGTLLITVVYLAVNGAIIAGLGFDRARASDAVAADLVATVLGRGGASIMAVVVMISALGAVNGLIFTGARVYASVGADYSALSWLGRHSGRSGSPIASLTIQLAITLVMMAIVGTAGGRGAIDSAIRGVGLTAPEWTGHGGFDTLLRCTAPVFWGFFLLTSLSLFVLRRKDPDRPRPFRVPLYPVLPLVFTGTCAFMLVSAIEYAGALTLVGLVPLVAGVFVYLTSKRRIEAPDDAAGDRAGMPARRTDCFGRGVEPIGERMP